VNFEFSQVTGVSITRGIPVVWGCPIKNEEKHRYVQLGEGSLRAKPNPRPDQRNDNFEPPIRPSKRSSMAREREMNRGFCSLEHWELPKNHRKKNKSYNHHQSSMSKVTKVAVFVTELQNCRAELQDTSGPS
jgi:hypothetical protein